MKKEAFDTAIRESKYLGLAFLIGLVIFKIVFYQENLIALFMNVLSLFWIFALPGYFIMLYWKEKLGFLERFVIGLILSAAIIGILSYYLGLMGLNIKYHAIILPLALIFTGIAVSLKSHRA